MCGNSKWRRPKLINLYLMQLGNSNIYKIGYTSNNPTERIKVIRYYVPEIKLIDFVLCEFRYEKELHNFFVHKKVIINCNGGKEFFKLNKSNLKYIQSFFTKIKINTN